MAVVVRSYPKIALLLWVMAWYSLFAFIITRVWPQTSPVVASIFVALLIFTALISSFEFDTWKLAIMIFLILLGVIVYIAFVPPEWKHRVSGVKLHIDITPDAYLTLCIGFFFILFLIWLSRRWYYWVITPNQIIYRRGLFKSEERYPTQGVWYSADVADVFEYFLFFRAGKLTMYLPEVRMTFVIPMVPNIRKVQRELKKTLGVIRVKQ